MKMFLVEVRKLPPGPPPAAGVYVPTKDYYVKATHLPNCLERCMQKNISLEDIVKVQKLGSNVI